MEEEKKSMVNEIASAGYDAADKPFDFIGTGNKTALVCESDQAVKEKITQPLKDMGYFVTEPASGREALKNMRFHVYDLIVLNESFDAAGGGEGNEVLNYLQNLAAATRRNIFVALLSDKYRTVDNMMAFNKSVNLVINTKNIDEFAAIIKRGVDENDAFYRVFRDSLKKMGRI